MTAPRGDGRWPTALQHYETAMRAAGRADGTIRLHLHYLRRLADQQPRPWSVTTEQLQAFLAPAHWSPETRKSARGAVRSFYRWGHGSGRCEDDPALELASVHVPPGIPRPTPEHLVRQLLGRDGRIGFMAMLAAYCGLRRGEIAQVHVDDLVGDELLVHGKGGKIRTVPVVDARLLALLSSLDGWAFPNGLGSHLSAGHVGRLLSNALPAGWTAHTLRHRCGTRAYAATRDLFAVQQLLGHSRPETTQRYVLLPGDAVRAAAAGAAS